MVRTSEKEGTNVMEEKKEDALIVAYEYTMARFERTIKRLIIALIIMIVLLCATNALWIYEWNQYDYADYSVDSRDGGNANYLEAGANGVINNAEGSSEKADSEK